MLSNFDVGLNFWSMNPQLKIAFRELYEGDESVDKKKSSRIMWAIALLWHPDSKFRTVGEEYRKKLIEDDFLKINEDGKGKKGRPKRFDWKEYTREIHRFRDLCLTKAQRFLVDWEQKLEERSHMIAEIEYDQTTFEMLDRMMERTDKMWKQYMSCLKDVEEDKTKGEARGGAVESLKDQGDI